MIRSTYISSAALLLVTLSAAPTSSGAEINQEIARAYNNGTVRCSNPECAKYLYACFMTYSRGSLNEFLTCGAQASRLNKDKVVVAQPVESSQ